MTMTWATPDDPVVKLRRQSEEAAAAREKAHRDNREIFVKMYLSLGPDAVVINSGRHDAALLEARGLAAHRWLKLHDLEAEAQKTGLKELKDQAKAERRALEALRVDYRGKK